MKGFTVSDIAAFLVAIRQVLDEETPIINGFP
jgi:hypothetical protein